MMLILPVLGIGLLILVPIWSRHRWILLQERARMLARASVAYGRCNIEFQSNEKRFEWVIGRMQDWYPRAKYDQLSAVVYAALWEVER